MTDLKCTPLFDIHVAAGAKMVPFASYEMPVSYPLGVMKEHIHCREKAGLFDVSHMGQVIVIPKSAMEDVALGLETMLPQNVLALKPWRQRYGFFTNNEGGILDDLMFANCEDHYFIVVNAACKDADFSRLKDGLSGVASLEMLDDRALLAIQGPKAEEALSALLPEVANMKFMDVLHVDWEGHQLWVSRSGYTGEDGYEISVPSDVSVKFASSLLKNDLVEWIGLGARDSLRLEAGLCLYGHDITNETTPIEANLLWGIQKARREGGEREGGFPGATQILTEIKNGTKRSRVGISPEGRAPFREGVKLYSDDTGETEIGIITSGGFGPTVGMPIAMGYILSNYKEVSTLVYADVRGKLLPAKVVNMPFVTANFKR